MLAIPLVFGLIAGDTETFSFSGKVRDCYITDGLSNLSDYKIDGLNFTESENNVIIYSNPLLASGNLTISCLVQGFREEQSSSGGGSSCSYDPDYDWECSAWSECINETQTRTCNERNNCGSIYGRPSVVNNCSEVIILDVNETIIDDVVIEDELSWWGRFWNWLKGLFSRD